MTEQTTEFSDEAASQPRPLRIETPQEVSCEPKQVSTADPCGPEVPWLSSSTPMTLWEKKAAADALWAEFDPK